MKKLITLLFWSFFVTVFGACKTSSVVTDIPAVIQPTETKLASSTSTIQFVPTIDPLTPTAIAEFFHTQEASIKTPPSSTLLTYEECSYWDELTTDQNWALCDPGADPITLINKSNQSWKFSYKTYYGKEVLAPCTRLLQNSKDGTYLYFSLIFRLYIDRARIYFIY